MIGEASKHEIENDLQRRRLQRQPSREPEKQRGGQETNENRWAQNRTCRRWTGELGKADRTLISRQERFFLRLSGRRQSCQTREHARVKNQLSNRTAHRPYTEPIETSTNRDEISKIEVDLSLGDAEVDPDFGIIAPSRTDSHLSKKSEFQLSTQLGEEEFFKWSRLFDKSLLAELITGKEDRWIYRLRRVTKRNNSHGFELLGPYTNPFGHQMAVVGDCIMVDENDTSLTLWPGSYARHL